MVKGLFQSIRCILKFKPDIVLGMGSYVCAPVILATIFFRIPVLLHEQNAIPGLTNRVLSRISTKIAISFPTTKEFFPKEKVTLTGTPIREEIGKVRKEDARLSLGLERDRFTLLLFGGSRGAHSINRAAVEALPKLEKLSSQPLQVIYITGMEDYEWVKDKLAGIKLKIKISEYLFDMSKAFAAADLVICRAGATTLAEIAACGLPAILIPYPHSAENHQLYNAHYFLKAGGAKLILDKDLTGELLAKSVVELIKRKDELSRMADKSKEFGKADASRKICELIYSIRKK
jgi:UDP-N-acetylglucosamine--N-acetylmuramyl-(pentapeptide) pyrophosphoryl-undecaprenol N-acetylglucosamine transferase